MGFSWYFLCSPSNVRTRTHHVLFATVVRVRVWQCEGCGALICWHQCWENLWLALLSDAYGIRLAPHWAPGKLWGLLSLLCFYCNNTCFLYWIEIFAHFFIWDPRKVLHIFIASRLMKPCRRNMFLGAFSAIALTTSSSVMSCGPNIGLSFSILYFSSWGSLHVYTDMCNLCIIYCFIHMIYMFVLIHPWCMLFIILIWLIYWPFKSSINLCGACYLCFYIIVISLFLT